MTNAPQNTASAPSYKQRMFAAYEWHIAGRYLRSRRREGFVSVIAGFSFAGIALGVATLIIVMAVMNGFRHQLLDRILGVNGHAVVQSMTGEMTDWPVLVDDITKVATVTSVTPMIEGQVMATAGQYSTGVLVRGMSEGDVRKLDFIAERVQAGDLSSFANGEIAIGIRLARHLGVGVGDTVSLISPKGRATPFGVAPRIIGFQVGAIFEIGMSEYDKAYVYMPLAAAQRYFGLGNKVTSLEIKVAQPDNIAPVTAAISDVVRAHVNSIAANDRSLRLLDWRDLNKTFFDALMVERNVMFLILTLIIMVAALNIISGLIMLVKDKGRDIAILRTMGVPAGAVMRIFFIAGASIGTVGTMIGIVIGVTFCTYIEEIRQFLSSLSGTELFSPEVYFLSRMPAHMDVGETVTICLMALALSFLATIYPARRAAKLDPVEALRYE